MTGPIAQLPLRLLFIGPAEALDHVRRHLNERFQVCFAGDELAVDRLMPESDIILDASLRVRFGANRISQAKSLKLFVTAATGADHVAADALSARGIPLWTLRDQPEVIRNITAAAEHSWLLLMACARGLPQAHQDVLDGRWDRQRHPGIMLRGKTLGIIGCGRIGQWMGRYAYAFGMLCIGYDPFVSPWPEVIVKSSLEKLLKESDFITVHVPLTTETRGLVNRDAIAMMKRGVVMINTSRGEIVDEGALLAALQDQRVAAAGLDVLSGEPEIGGHALVEYARSHPNLIITPHIAGYSPDALRQVLTACCARITHAFEDVRHR